MVFTYISHQFIPTLHSSKLYLNFPMIVSSIDDDNNPFVPTHNILSICDEDEGKYTCYCYTTLVILSKHKSQFAHAMKVPTLANSYLSFLYIHWNSSLYFSHHHLDNL